MQVDEILVARGIGRLRRREPHGAFLARGTLDSRRRRLRRRTRATRRHSERQTPVRPSQMSIRKPRTRSSAKSSGGRCLACCAGSLSTVVVPRLVPREGALQHRGAVAVHQHTGRRSSAPAPRAHARSASSGRAAPRRAACARASARSSSASGRRRRGRPGERERFGFMLEQPVQDAVLARLQARPRVRLRTASRSAAPASAATRPAAAVRLGSEAAASTATRQRSVRRRAECRRVDQEIDDEAEAAQQRRVLVHRRDDLVEVDLLREVGLRRQLRRACTRARSPSAADRPSSRARRASASTAACGRAESGRARLRVRPLAAGRSRTTCVELALRVAQPRLPVGEPPVVLDDRSDSCSQPKSSRISETRGSRSVAVRARSRVERPHERLDFAPAS